MKSAQLNILFLLHWWLVKVMSRTSILPTAILLRQSSPPLFGLFCHVDWLSGVTSSPTTVQWVESLFLYLYLRMFVLVQIYNGQSPLFYEANTVNARKHVIKCVHTQLTDSYTVTSHLINCVTRAPLLYFIRSWVAPSFKVVSQSVSQASVIPVQIFTLFNIQRHKCPLLTQYHQLPTANTS